MTFKEHVKNKRLRWDEIAIYIGMDKTSLYRYHKKGLDKMPFDKAIKLCDFVGISKQEFIKGNIKPLKGRR